MTPAIIAITIFTLLAVSIVFLPNSVPLIVLIIVAVAWYWILQRANHDDTIVKMLSAFDRGVTSAEQGSYRAAIKDFSFILKQPPQKLKKFPHTIETYFNRGTAYYLLHNYVEAVRDFNSAIHLNPEYADAYINRGEVHLAQNVYQKAIKDFTKAIYLNSKYVTVYESRGIALSYMGNNKRALEDFSTFLHLQPSTVAYYNCAIIQYLLGMSHEALSSFDEALKLDVYNMIAYYCRGNILYDLGKQKDALEDYQRAKMIEAEQIDNITSEDAHGFYHRGLERYRTGDKEKAITDMEEAIAICQRHKNQLFQQKVVATLGKIQTHTDDNGIPPNQ